MDNNSKIFVAGHNGLVGSALIRELKRQDYTNIITVDKSELNLCDQGKTYDWFYENRPEYVFLAAAKVGGIEYNKTYPADFIYENLMIQTNVINAAAPWIKKLLFLGSACIYPKHAPVPIKEEYLMTGKLEPTNDAYAVAKIAGIKMCQAYTEQFGKTMISVMPNNLYGPNDNFNLFESHVIPALINKFLDAKEKGLTKVVCWGDGSPTREFLYSDDLANGLIFLMNNYDSSNIINIGPNREVSIRDLVETIARMVQYKGDIIWDTARPNGTPRRALDTSVMDAMGWKAQTELEMGLAMTIEWYLTNRKIART